METTIMRLYRLRGFKMEAAIMGLYRFRGLGFGV